MIVDSHVHFEGLDLAGKMLEDQANTGTDQFNILVIERLSDEPDAFRQPHALWFKMREPERVFAFGGLDFDGVYNSPARKLKMDLAEQVERLIAVGFDGLKLLTGKPNVRHLLGLPLDGEVYEPMWRKLEETQFPIVWHVADPAEFWDANAVPLWAKQQKWWYSKDTPPKAQIDREALNVLDKHPRLNLVIAHFFFQSGDLPAAGKLLAKHPNLKFDLAPGVEMNHNFTANHAAAREFFIRHADRILFGTDIGMMEHGTGPKRGWMVRHFLESDEVFDVPDDVAMTPDERPALHGLGLPGEVTAKIMGGNFHRLVGRKTPKPVDAAAARSYLRELAGHERQLGHPVGAAERTLTEMGQLV